MYDFLWKVCGLLPTRQTLWQVDVAVFCGEVHPVTGWAQQTPAGKYGYSSVGVLLAGGGVLLDENQVTDHNGLRLGLVVEPQQGRR